MEDQTIIKFEISLAANKIISQVISRNERMQEELEMGIEEAVNEFDFKKYCKEYTTQAIQSAIKTSSEWGKIRELAKIKTDEVINNFIDSQLEIWKKDFVK